MKRERVRVARRCYHLRRVREFSPVSLGAFLQVR